jgi:hypothetical protein
MPRLVVVRRVVDHVGAVRLTTVLKDAFYGIQFNSFRVLRLHAVIQIRARLSEPAVGFHPVLVLGDAGA